MRASAVLTEPTATRISCVRTSLRSVLTQRELRSLRTTHSDGRSSNEYPWKRD